MIYTRNRYNAPKLGPNMARQGSPIEAFLHHTDDIPLVVGELNTKEEQVSKIREIDQFHRVQRGWSMCGYHWLVFQMTGTRWEPRAFAVRPIHFTPAAQLNHNTRTVAICVVGNGNVNQLHGNTRALIAKIIRRYPNVKTLGGHRDVVATDCPGRNFYNAIPNTAKLAKVKVYR